MNLKYKMENYLALTKIYLKTLNESKNLHDLKGIVNQTFINLIDYGYTNVEPNEEKNSIDFIYNVYISKNKIQESIKLKFANKIDNARKLICDSWKKQLHSLKKTFQESLKIGENSCETENSNSIVSTKLHKLLKMLEKQKEISEKILIRKIKEKEKIFLQNLKNHRIFVSTAPNDSQLSENDFFSNLLSLDEITKHNNDSKELLLNTENNFFYCKTLTYPKNIKIIATNILSDNEVIVYVFDKNLQTKILILYDKLLNEKNRFQININEQIDLLFSDNKNNIFMLSISSQNLYSFQLIEPLKAKNSNNKLKELEIKILKTTEINFNASSVILSKKLPGTNQTLLLEINFQQKNYLSQDNNGTDKIFILEHQSGIIHELTNLEHHFNQKKSTGIATTLFPLIFNNNDFLFFFDGTTEIKLFDLQQIKFTQNMTLKNHINGMTFSCIAPIKSDDNANNNLAIVLYNNNSIIFNEFNFRAFDLKSQTFVSEMMTNEQIVLFLKNTEKKHEDEDLQQRINFLFNINDIYNQQEKNKENCSPSLYFFNLTLCKMQKIIFTPKQEEGKKKQVLTLKNKTL